MRFVQWAYGGCGLPGGDVFANLLHLQRHRRGRGLLALQKAAEEGKLTSNTLSHFVVPLCLQAARPSGVGMGSACVAAWVVTRPHGADDSLPGTH